ncbi:rhodanese-like domain-containing protein [Cohnella sp. 56]|uniref:rhodanese-like domain-containing protein n=1 Tax=Cohnella sp. 56 TaxID=3113722 RepID=UPI0030E9F23F
MKKIDDESILLLDLRSKEEYEAGHIAEAISVPMSERDSFMRDLSNHAEVIAYSRGPLCLYSAIAAEKLQANGITAYRMDEGINEWQEHFQLKH